MKFSKRAQEALRRNEQRRNNMSGIRITQHANGQFDIKSDFPGPFTTIAVLRQVITLLEKAALEAEIEAAQSRVAVPTPGQVRELVPTGRG